MLLFDEILQSLQYLGTDFRILTFFTKNSNFSLLLFRWLYINSAYNAEVLCPMCFQQYENLALLKCIS